MYKKSCAVTMAAVCCTIIAFTGATLPAHAQQAPIERVRLSDNDLSCAQLHAEAGEMDKAIAEAKAQEGQGNTTAMAGTAGNVATEVAARTGFFGALGGLAGHIAGQIAARTAASAAQQSGQSTVQQAAERTRQAGARKEHVSALFLNKGCKTADLDYNPPAPANPPPVQVAAAETTVSTPPAMNLAAVPPVSLPELDPDSFFRGKTGGTFGKNIVEVLPGNKRVAIAGFRVAYIVSNTASATVRGSYMPGRDTSGAHSTLVVTLSGVDAASLQALTDKAYADFLAQMRLAGRDVVPQEELRDFLSGVDAVPTSLSKPYSKEVGSQTALVFAPTGMPLWFHNSDGRWFDKSPFEQKNMRSAAEYSHKLNAIVIAPLIIVDFARMSSSGNQSGFVARSAETGASLAMRVSGFSSHVVRSEETRSGLVMKGDDGSVSLDQRSFVSELKFGTIREASASDNRGTKGIFDALGSSMGMANAGGAARSRSENVAETSNAQYTAAAADALVLATGTFAKLFQKYPAK